MIKTRPPKFRKKPYRPRGHCIESFKNHRWVVWQTAQSQLVEAERCVRCKKVSLDIRPMTKVSLMRLLVNLANQMEEEKK